jgi:chemotaxis family two-component system response regulator Rcp1
MTKTEEKLLQTRETPWEDRMVVCLHLPKANGLERLTDPRSVPAIGHTPMDILLVDDNAGDVRMVTDALKEALPAARLSVAIDGDDAIQFLRRQGRYHKAPRPDLILLDLRLPKKSGFDVLTEIKQDQDLRKIPIVVQTSSEAPTDVLRAYSLHANCYITKTSDLDEFSRIMRVLAEFWVTIAKLPQGGSYGAH